RFMRDYYLHARAIHRVSRRLIARCQETLSRRSSAGRRQRQQALADGLVFFDGQLHLVDRDSGPLRADPARLMKVFWHLHRLGCELSLDLERAVEDSLYLADGSFQRSAAVRDLFLDICRTWGRVAQTFREMHEIGLLGRFLPEFGALTCLVQYDIDDPKTIADFAATVGDPQRLKMLYLLTWADMRAVGPGVLTPWQATILHELYRRSLARLTGGRSERPSRTQLAERLRLAVGEE